MVFANYGEAPRRLRARLGAGVSRVAAAVAPRRRVDDGAGAVRFRPGNGVPNVALEWSRRHGEVDACSGTALPPGRARAARGAALEPVSADAVPGSAQAALGDACGA